MTHQTLRYTPRYAQVNTSHMHSVWERIQSISAVKKHFPILTQGQHFPILTRGQDRVVVRLPHCHHKDVGSNPAATRNEKWTLG